ncbi:MAG: N-formylglutamate amidohydrolase [Nitrospira sp.]|nr:N-formylglutamate amidohydrolase [Nitrospira sp.]
MKTVDGEPLRRTLSPKEQIHLLDVYFHPYAKSFEGVVSRMLDRHGRCLIFDSHSFPSLLLRYELDQEIRSPEVCLGADPFHTPESLLREVEAVCIGQGLRTERNRPFAGTYVPLCYWQKDSCVSSVMMEIQRDLYMDEVTGAETLRLKRMQELLFSILEGCAKL